MKLNYFWVSFWALASLLFYMAYQQNVFNYEVEKACYEGTANYSCLSFQLDKPIYLNLSNSSIVLPSLYKEPVRSWKEYFSKYMFYFSVFCGFIALCFFVTEIFIYLLSLVKAR